MTIKQTDREKGRAWFGSLSDAERWALGDDFVLDTFSWPEWGFEKRPTSAFLSGADAERILWEQTNAG